jgi:peptidoglycan/LPS O-acetylase OafA/YrhL
MKRRVLWVVLLVVIAVAIAYVLLTAWQALISSPPTEAFGSAATLLFTFMDVGLIAFAVVMIVFAIRGIHGYGRVVLTAFLATVLNFIVVIVVGFIQGGAAPWGFMLFAVTAGIAFMIGVLIAAPIAKRIAKPSVAV